MRSPAHFQRVARELLDLQLETGWSWETMAQEFSRVMSQKGPSSATLLRYANHKVRRPNLLLVNYVVKAIQKLRKEISSD